MKTLAAIMIVCVTCITYAASPETEKIWVYTGTWIIDFYPNGRASAQYGSNPGDSGYVNEGTINFKALLESVSQARKKSKRDPGDRFQVGIQREGQTTTTAFVLADDSFLEQTLLDLDGRWKPHPAGQRFFDLKAKSPIIPKKEESSEQRPQPYR